MSQCPKKKGKGKQRQMHVSAFVENQRNEFIAKFEKGYLMIYCPSTVPIDAWYVNSGAS